MLQGVSKGGMVEAILTAAARTGAAPDFVLCIGDDRSDEDMFTAMEHVTFSPHLPAEVRARADWGFLGAASMLLHTLFLVAGSGLHAHLRCWRPQPGSSASRMQFVLLQVFACTVGQKPSKAPFYVNDTVGCQPGYLCHANTRASAARHTAVFWTRCLVQKLSDMFVVCIVMPRCWLLHNRRMCYSHWRGWRRPPGRHPWQRRSQAVSTPSWCSGPASQTCARSSQ